MDTTRKYYFKPDAESRKILPELFRINHDGINHLIKENGELCESLREIRLDDDETREAQLELDEILRLEKEAYEEVKAEDDAALKRLSAARYAASKLADKTRHAELHKAYSNLKAEAKKKRQKRMWDFNASVRERRYAAQKVVSKANVSDYNAAWKDHFKDFKKEYTKQTSLVQKYHLDNYNTNRLKQARAELQPDQRVDLRKFVRGYGTNLPVSDSIVTGHSQSAGGDGKTKTGGKYTTVAEYRQGKSGGSHIRKLSFPEPWVWEPRIPKGERKRSQVGAVEVSLLGRAVRGTCLFHQSLPDDHCIVGAALIVSVHSGNTYFYITLTARPKSEMGKKSYEALKAFFDDLGDVDTLDTDEVKEARGKVIDYKKKLAQKKADQDTLSEVDSKLKELSNRAAVLKEAEKKGKK